MLTDVLEDVKRKKQAEEHDKAQKEKVRCRKLKRGKCEGELLRGEELRGERERSKTGNRLSRLARKGDSGRGNAQVSNPARVKDGRICIHPSYGSQLCQGVCITEMIILEFALGSLSLQRAQLHAGLSVVQVLHGVGERKLFQRKNGCN